MFDDIHPMAIVFALVGIALAWIMTGRMNAGIFIKILTTLITGFVIFVMVNKISTS